MSKLINAEISTLSHINYYCRPMDYDASTHTEI